MKVDFAKFFQIMCSASPKLKRSLWKVFYQYLASFDRDGELLFMNYGFADHNLDCMQLSLEDFDENFKNFVNSNYEGKVVFLKFNQLC